MLIEKILQGPNSAYLSETMVEDLCHRRASSISPTVTHIQSHSLRAAGWRHVGSGKMFNQRSPVQAVLLVSETLTQHWAATSQREANHPNTGSILSCIINTLCHHCVWLSWTRSHTGSTFVFSSHTNLTSTHTALTQPLNIPKLVLRLYVLYLTFDPVHKCVCERDAEREGALPHASVRTYFKHFMGI